MLVQNPIRETWDEMKEKYDGFCIFVAKCSDNGVRPKSGEVWAYNESLAELTGEVDHLFEGDDDSQMGIHSFITLTGFADCTLMHVVALDD